MTKEAHRKWLGLLAMIPALAMVFIDQAVLPVALPTIQEQFKATQNTLWWSVNSYLLVSAVLVLLGGKLGDKLGHRRTFLWGIAIFALSSALCGLSINMVSLIAARGVQGIGAALMIPASSPLIMSLFPAHQRGRAIGINVSISSLFLLFAPLLGGYLTEAVSWRWIFWINLPIAAIGLPLVLLFIRPSPKGLQKIDWCGFLFFACGATALVILLMQIGTPNRFSLENGLLALLFLGSAFLIMWREKRVANPFIDLSLFRHPIYKAVNISVFATQFILMITVYRAFFCQETLGWSAIKSGTIFFITSLPILFMSIVAGALSDRFGSKVPIATGFTILIYSFFWLGFFVEEHLVLLLIGFITFSIGIPLILTPSYSAAMSSIPPTKAGIAFGTLATFRALAASLGVAVIISFEQVIQEHFLQTLIKKDPQINSLPASLWHALQGGLANIAPLVSSKQLQIIASYNREAQMRGFIVTHFTIGFLLILAFAIVFTLYHRESSHHLPEAPAEGWD